MEEKNYILKKKFEKKNQKDYWVANVYLLIQYSLHLRYLAQVYDILNQVIDVFTEGTKIKKKPLFREKKDEGGSFLITVLFLILNQYNYPHRVTKKIKNYT